ncbi:hypothetical protein NEOLI_001282 [Neolecta irregularis DAH-3]|uniref:DNA mismatch repair protein S5 domain-containing protein n=1 Tax=Neolecta irregularis (strain DAH-3) TaxID=1198029 RepID=A0A1U7LKC3_NEOID|nr:hypothetical protein NEOLI_001282 [Neolecta irregularis DAH-3]|eukprot:OLL23043.1 hypothetical protein NEOLI_001282 [Neolecta irregularis DAH-3]
MMDAPPETDANLPRPIKALDATVVNRIAAGEVGGRKLSPLIDLELIENSIDARSTSIDILVKDGGLKLLQITDNGHGVRKDDMAILCERFTTSKLQTFEDLSSIATYGFRGEALASISHVAHMTVTTRTASSDCAWRACYSDGKLVAAKNGISAEPKPTAGRQGTQITAEDLFYNVPTRRKAFKNTNEEYSRIVDVVSRYAVHCEGHGDNNYSVSTMAKASSLDNIRQIYGHAVASETVAFSCSNTKFGFQAKGLITNANYHAKRMIMLLFINHRLVESSSLKKNIEATYSTFLPKGSHPFINISIEIEPHRVDVNVHPTKREVHFLNQEEIIDDICAALQRKLASTDTSRSFKTQTLLPGVKPVELPATVEDLSKVRKPYEKHMVRTDSRDKTLDSHFTPLKEVKSNISQVSSPICKTTDRRRVHIRLSSIKELRSQVRDTMHSALTEVFASHTFVGIVDETRRLAAIQHGTKLYLVDYGAISFDLFYQIGLTDFGNFGVILLNPPLEISALLELAASSQDGEDAVMSDINSPEQTQINAR